MGSLFILLPAYNEAENLAPLFEQCAELAGRRDPSGSLALKVVVVDDGSGDATARAGENFRGRLDIAVARHERNRGLAEALRTGLNKILAEAAPQDWAVTLDADNSHPPALILAMLKKAEAGCDVVIASRYAPGGKETGLAPHRRLLSRACNALLSEFFPIPGATDYSCMFRLMRISALAKVAGETGGRFFEEGGFACVAELLLNLAKCGARVGEVGLPLRYDLKRGESKMKVLRTIGGYSGLIRRRKRWRSP